MGCTLNKHDEINERMYSPYNHRVYLLRHAIQNIKHVKYAGIPELNKSDQSKILLSSKKYLDFIESSSDINHFTDIQIRYPNILKSYFQYFEVDTSAPQIQPHEELKLNMGDFAWHMNLSKTVIKSCVFKLATGGTEILEDSLRRIGAHHAENWVCSKDMLCIEESFMWALDKSDPHMNTKMKTLWRKLIRFILHNIVMGINSHYEKLNFVLDMENTRCFCLDPKPPKGVNSKSHESLKKLAVFMKAQTDS